MIRPPPRSNRTDPLSPYPSRFRSWRGRGLEDRAGARRFRGGERYPPAEGGHGGACGDRGQRPGCRAMIATASSDDDLDPVVIVCAGPPVCMLQDDEAVAAQEIGRATV